MSQRWHPNEDATPTPRDVREMACTLEGRHGQYAVDVAEFFSAQHALGGDAGRSWAWAGVAETIRHRARQRLSER